MRLMERNEVTIVSCLRPEKDGESYRITFSNGEALSFTEEEVLEHGLHREGEPCRGYEEICTVVLAKRMMASAASYVLFSTKTEAQVRRRLAEKFPVSEIGEGWARFTAAALEETIRRLKELGYLDDAAYCEKFIASVFRSKPVSRAYLTKELVYQKGVAREVAESALDAAYAEPGAPSDDENAYRLLYKKTRGHLSDDSRQLAGLYRFLAAKGFSAASAEYAMRKIKEEGEDSNEGLL